MNFIISIIIHLTMAHITDDCGNTVIFSSSFSAMQCSFYKISWLLVLIFSVIKWCIIEITLMTYAFGWKAIPKYLETLLFRNCDFVLFSYFTISRRWLRSHSITDNYRPLLIFCFNIYFLLFYILNLIVLLNFHWL